MSQQWTQLIYTSSDSGAGTGGWGVKEISGGHEELLERLRAGVTTLLEEVDATPTFATAAELEARPRKLTFSLDAEDALLWHAAAAGPDATGRPGNVFTHAVSYPAMSAPLARPISYWRSPDWLTPYGALEVGEARLGSSVRPGEAVTRASVLSFIRSSPARRNSLEWLLAAVDHAISRQIHLVIAVSSVDEAASWIGAVSHLTAPALARRLSWTTFERASTLPDSIRRELRLVFVPRHDLNELYGVLGSEDAGLLVLDPEQEIADPVDGQWRTSHQTFPAATQWQDAMLDLFALNEGEAARVLRLMDAICVGVTHTEALGLPMHWPLSVAMLAGVGAEEEGRAERIDALLADAPQSSLSHEAIRQLLEERPSAAVELGWGSPTTVPEAPVGVPIPAPVPAPVPPPIAGPRSVEAVIDEPGARSSSRVTFGRDLHPAGAGDPVEPAAAPAQVPVHSSEEPSTGAPVMLSTERLEALIQAQMRDVASRTWLLKALEAVLGLDPLAFSPPTRPQSAATSRAVAEQLLGAVSSPDLVRAAAAHWLACYWLLQDIQPTPEPYPPNPTLAAELRRHEDLVLGALAYEMHRSPAVGALIVRRGCLRETMGSQSSIQTLAVGGLSFGRMVAIRALRSGIGARRSALAQAIIEGAERDVSIRSSAAMLSVLELAWTARKEENKLWQ